MTHHSFYSLGISVQPTSLILPILVTIFLVLVNGLFVAAEFAIIGVRPTQVEPLAKAGNKRARLVLKILESPNATNKYIATAQLGITLASLGLGMYAEPRIALFIEPYINKFTGTSLNDIVIHSIAMLISLAFLTYMHVVLGEMIPKSLALSNPKRASLTIMSTMYWAQKFLSLPVSGLNFLGDSLLRLLKVRPPESDARLHSTRELAQIVSESALGGKLQDNEKMLLLGVLGFADQKVHQIMTPRNRIQAISYDTPLDQIMTQVSDSRYSRFPVYRNDLDHIIGILHVKDLASQQLLDNDNLFDLRLLMRPAPYIPEHTPLTNMMSAFKRNHVHMVVALDEYGGTAGIVTLEDLVEEIVGEVRDEFDLYSEPVVITSPTALETQGSCPVNILQEYVDLGSRDNLPDVETVSGLLMTWLGRPPQPRDRYIHNGNILFTVLSVDGFTATKVCVEFPVPSKESSVTKD
jgi:CBS domain containing-hemolysin-like protein